MRIRANAALMHSLSPVLGIILPPALWTHYPTAPRRHRASILAWDLPACPRELRSPTLRISDTSTIKLIITTMISNLLISLLLITAENIVANEPLRSWYPYRYQSAKQRRESSFSSPQLHSGSGLELSACPAECRCFTKTVRCFGQGLTDIPKNIPPDTERL